jgi:hypothetical protein
MSATAVAERAGVHGPFPTKVEAEAAFAVIAAEAWGTGHVVSMVTEKSMGTETSWSVKVWPVNRPGVDTSCVFCGCHSHAAATRPACPVRSRP